MTDHTTPDESQKAVRIINDAIAASRGPISHATARLIAAAINEGDQSELLHFASTGQFDLDTLGHEVTRLALPINREPWRRALLDFLLSMRRSHPWARSSVRRVPSQYPQGAAPAAPPLTPHGGAMPGNSSDSEVKYKGNENSTMRQSAAPVNEHVNARVFRIPETEELVLTVPEAADRLRVSHWTIYRLMREGKLRTIQIGTRRLVPASALRAFLDDQPEQGTTGRG